MCRMGSKRLPCAAVLLLLLLGAAAGWPSKKDDSIEAKLARWVTSSGGKLKGFKVGRECPTCLRGVIASRDFKPGDVIMKVPFTTVLRLKDIEHAAFPSEYARDLLDSMHNDPTFNETWGLFWSAHPGPEDVFTPEVYTDEHLEMLQSPALASLVAGQRQVAEQVYDGTYVYQNYTPFSETVPEDKVSLDTFKYVSSLLGSRYFGFYRDGNLESPASHLVPLVDLINHADDPNAERSDDSTNVLVKAIKPIKKGQEITNNYQPAVIHRPDMSLYIYGFVIDRETPFLSAVDLPDYDPQDPFGQSALQDDLYDDPKGKYATAEEYQRLAALLREGPTTEEEDRKELESGNVTDWRIRAILQFRVMRKRALRQSMAKLASTLGLSEDQLAAITASAPEPAAAEGEQENDDEYDEVQEEEVVVEEEEAKDEL